jgi:hypothetical protein
MVKADGIQDFSVRNKFTEGPIIVLRREIFVLKKESCFFSNVYTVTIEHVVIRNKH